MIELAAITGPGTALAAGLVTSVHCAGMCGPLACAVMPVAGESADGSTVAATYHTARLSSYLLLGAAAGGLGRLPLTLLDTSVVRLLPWLLVVFFVGVAFRLDRRLPRPIWMARWHGKAVARWRGMSRVRAAAVLGMATPLLPCGPLYFVLGLALLSGSAARGAEMVLAFGLGTVPLLWLVQSQFVHLRRRMSPGVLTRCQAALALVTAAVLAWRLRATLGLGGPGVGDFVCF
ncbi:MAG TPA: sulfite exporter TauE/SafE family protein [Candidatus Didemnitutus sp.]|nr:sulfite exporter TauE/SafE family protein [Candidatus Didemnitutus sp.]